MLRSSRNSSLFASSSQLASTSQQVSTSRLASTLRQKVGSVTDIPLLVPTFLTIYGVQIRGLAFWTHCTFAFWSLFYLSRFWTRIWRAFHGMPDDFRYSYALFQNHGLFGNLRVAALTSILPSPHALGQQRE